MLRERPSAVWEKVNSGFWFVPALMVAGSIVLYAVTLTLDQLTFTSLSALPIVFSGGASAARSVLAAISGSLITVITTAFSLTIVAFVLASGQYTPRLLRSFTADRGLQVVMGTYIATFVYALLVLRIVRTAESESAAFIPIISVTTAVVLALLCVALLVYFVQHVMNLIQPSTIVQRIQAETMEPLAGLDDLNGPPEGERDQKEDPNLKSLLAEAPLELRARQSGYVQYLNIDAIVEAVSAARDPEFIEIPFSPGHFVAAGLPVVRIWPAREDTVLDSGTEDKVRQAIVFGQERAFRQDFTFGLRQLTDIALKGLSPSTNDPTTAMQALDRIEAVLVALGEKALPRRVQERGTNEARVLVKIGYPSFDDIVELALDQVRRAAFATGQVVFLRRLLEVTERALEANTSPERQKALWDRAFTVARLATEQLPDTRDAVTLVQRTVEVGAPLLETEQSAAVGSDLEELVLLSEGLRGGERVREAVRGAVGGAPPAARDR